MSDKRCLCTLGQSLTGDGCRYCQPQEYIERLEEFLEEDRKQLQKYESAALSMYETFDDWVNDLDFESYQALSRPVSELRNIFNGTDE